MVLNNKVKLIYLLPVIIFCFTHCGQDEVSRPNILILISDDQSFAHTSFSGCKYISTPAFDKIAGDGAFFTNAIAASPGCSPSRAAILTGKYPWQIEEAGTHASSFPSAYLVLPDILEDAGYIVGFTGKGWAPGNYELSGRTRNPAGNDFSGLQLNPPYKYISTNDYSGNFKDFYNKKAVNQPFYFWMGFNEPHREFEKGIWEKESKSLEDARVPLFLPDVPEVREDILDYAVEIEWFDKQVQKTLEFLKEKGELDNTIVVITSDNGMAFPRAKANCFEYGIHVPLAIRWGEKISAGIKIADVVSLIDLTPTFLEAAGFSDLSAYSFSGNSLLDLLISNKSTKTLRREFVFSSRERHSNSRYNNKGYPQRAIRTSKFLYIKNYTPEAWPAGDPLFIDSGKNLKDAFFDVDDSPSKQFMLHYKNDRVFKTFFEESFGKRPEAELYDIVNDPNCLQNLVEFSEYENIKNELSDKLTGYLKETGDPRENGNPGVFETYPRLEGPIRIYLKKNEK